MKDYYYSESGKKKVEAFIKECEANRKEILDANKDTADETALPDAADILADAICSFDEDNEYYNCWGVTDNYNSVPISLKLGEDIIEGNNLEVLSVFGYAHPEDLKIFNLKGVKDATVGELINVLSALDRNMPISISGNLGFAIAKQRLVNFDGIAYEGYLLDSTTWFSEQMDDVIDSN